MVLQRDMPLPVWGNADPGEQVTVRVGEQRATAVANNEGAWSLVLPAMSAGGPHAMTVAGRGDDTVTIQDILVGDVWICSGQSNMNFRVQNVKHRDAEIAAADHPRLRHFQIANRVSPTPLRDFSGTWTVCRPDTVAAWTAVGYFFGRELHTRLDVPVGLVHTSWGGTPAEAWTAQEVLESMPECAPILERFRTACEKYPEARRKYDAETVPAWQEKVTQAKAAGTQPPRKPQPPMNETDPKSPSGLYNAMIHPLVPFAVRGAIWYQGESNAGRAVQYRTLFPAMIRNWRTVWAQGDFPFYFVQLANFMKPQDDPNRSSSWAELREAQAMTLTLPNTGMACIIDIGEADDIHPRNKQDVGLRLALCALAGTYAHRDLVCSGPTFREMTREGQALRLRFDHGGGGLAVRGDTLTGFAIAGADQRFVRATARIDGDSVLVQAPELAEPVAVRYGWADNPPCNLYNREGLPAVPFRTDRWPEATREAL
ncbi:MAG: sialate O-acetylesterase [Lentisphaeria bacterium]|nr:sialate O-acetylesterase [Lentisphaeria bacterium]